MLLNYSGHFNISVSLRDIPDHSETYQRWDLRESAKAYSLQRCCTPSQQGFRITESRARRHVTPCVDTDEDTFPGTRALTRVIY
jgi:hypothetical protein